jgi:DNA-binding transcriptional LysR family regulator
MDWRSVRFDWNRARAFLVTAEEGSFSAAARALGLAQPTLGRQVAALEEELGVALFERVGATLELTTAGLELVEHARAMGDAATRVSIAATGQATAIDGPVCVTASEILAAFLLPRAVARIRAEHPGIELELVASNTARDLRRREADIAVRNFTPTQPDLVAKKIGESRGYMYATPEYVARKQIASRADLSRADFFTFDRTDMMINGLRALGAAVTNANFPILSESHLVQWELAKRGLGICFVMAEVGDREPAVVRVLPGEVPAVPVPIWLACHRELRTSRRIRVVFDLLAEELAAALDPAS